MTSEQASQRSDISPDDVPLGYDVSDPSIYEQDTWRPYFARLRRDDPVHYHPDTPYGAYWSVTRYDDIMTVELDHETFSSARGIQLFEPPVGMERENFIRMDPPRHTAQRRTVAPMANRGNLGDFEPIIRQRTEGVLDNLPRNEAFDWVDCVSIELTTMMLATLFDFPWEERRKLTFWSDVAIANTRAPDAPVTSEEARTEELDKMGAYFRTLWNERAARPPQSDLISMMAHSEATRDMPPMEYIGNLALLIVGGNDTTRNSMSGGLLALWDNPQELSKLRADPGLVPNMVAESIRYQTPVIHMRRTATADTELAGKHIKADDKVIMWYVSGNRDDTVIDEPEAFRVDRDKARRHLSYGAGIHRCVGDRLADLQLRVLWEEFLKRDLEFEILDAPTRLYSNFIRGIRKLPVRIRG